MSTIRQALIDYIAANCPEIKKVRGVADATAVLNNKIPAGRTPAAFVMPVRSTSQKPLYANSKSTKHDWSFAVLLLVRHAGDGGSGEQTSDEIETLVRALRDAIKGVQLVVPDLKIGTIQLQSGALLAWKVDRLIWQETITIKETLC